MPNRLADQQSTYLLSHAKDPVDWYPWGPEAFMAARKLDRPVLISIGYDSCHWCHVMQRESFRDEAVAATLNESFICVKVDRELRPDVDHFYMTYTTLATGRGGWPMTVFAAPDGKPFFAGTYFPPTSEGGVISFPQVLEGVIGAYAQDAEETSRVGDEAIASVSQVVRPQPLRPVERELIDAAAKEIFAMQDSENGGIGDAPKFPQAPVARFLMGYASSTGSKTAAEMSSKWAYSMLRSGTYDQVGGGLFRYSTDAAWLVPHFEKMLYDNALLLSTIAALQHSEPSEELAHYAHQIASFLERDLAAPGGGYYSSLDAETDGVEGGTYTWRWSELESLLDARELQLATDVLGVAEGGEWEGVYVLTLRDGREAADTEALDTVLDKLLAARQNRPQPKLITNLLTDWNALAARGLIEAGLVLRDEDMVAQGLRVVEWLRSTAISDGRVLHAPADPSAADLVLIDDYAAVILALTAAADAAASVVGGRSETEELALRQEASTLLDTALELFEEGSVLYMTALETDLPMRPISYDDAPTPSGAAMLAEAYMRLKPDDTSGLDRLLVPATGIVTRASYMAGTWLRVMSLVTSSK